MYVAVRCRVNSILRMASPTQQQLDPLAASFLPCLPTTPAPYSLPPPLVLPRPRPLTSGGGDSTPHLSPPMATSTPFLATRHCPTSPLPTATLRVGQEQLTVSGSSAELVRMAKIVLHEFFNVGATSWSSGRLLLLLLWFLLCSSLEPPGTDDSGLASLPLDGRTRNYSGSSLEEGKVEEGDDEEKREFELMLVKPELSYDRAELLEMAQSPLCR